MPNPPKSLEKWVKKSQIFVQECLWNEETFSRGKTFSLSRNFFHKNDVYQRKPKPQQQPKFMRKISVLADQPLCVFVNKISNNLYTCGLCFILYRTPFIAKIWTPQYLFLRSETAHVIHEKGWHQLIVQKCTKNPIFLFSFPRSTCSPTEANVKKF